MEWIDVGASGEVPAGGVLRVEVAGLALAVWRTGAGQLASCDARCPHQWSDLGVVGVVAGDELVCRSHHWRFDPSGRGSKVSVRGRRDPKGDIGTHEVREVGGRIEVAVDADRS